MTLRGGICPSCSKSNNLRFAHRVFFFFMVSWDINNQYLGLQDETNLCQPQKKWEGIKYFNLSLLQPSAILPVSPTGQTQPEGKWQGYL